MKHQQVVVDYWTMFKTSCTCLMLAISGYVLLKMIQTIFYLPRYLKNNQNRLEELAAKYNIDLEKEIAEGEELASTSNAAGQDLPKTIKTEELIQEPKKVK